MCPSYGSQAPWLNSEPSGPEAVVISVKYVEQPVDHVTTMRGFEWNQHIEIDKVNN